MSDRLLELLDESDRVVDEIACLLPRYPCADNPYPHDHGRCEREARAVAHVRDLEAWAERAEEWIEKAARGLGEIERCDKKELRCAACWKAVRDLATEAEAILKVKEERG